MSDFMRNEAMEVAIELLKAERDKLYGEVRYLEEERDENYEERSTWIQKFYGLQSQLTKAKEALDIAEDIIYGKDHPYQAPTEDLHKKFTRSLQALTELADKP